MNSDMGFFLAVAGLATIVWTMAAVLLNCRRLIRGDWAEASVSIFSDQSLPEWMRWLAGSVPQLRIELERIRRDLRRAGAYTPDAFERLMALRNSLVWCCLFAIPLLLVIFGTSTNALRGCIGGGILAAIVFYAIPGLFLNARGRVRASEVISSVPEVLDIISMCLSGGLTLEQSLPRIIEYSPYVSTSLTRELQLVVRQAQTSSAGQAFDQLAERIDEPELRSLAATVLHTERLGTDMRRAIDALSQSIRTTLKHEAEARANSLSLKMLFPVIFCICPPVFFILMVPPVVRLREHFQSELIPSNTRELLESGAGGISATPPE
ncbi:MAG: type II secretion system F family protein [Planctomycetota bacterium]